MILKEKAKKNLLITALIGARKSELFWVISFAVLTIFAAQVAVPTQPVPFTLQTMLVLLSGAFLGSKNGSYSQIIYLSAGIIGLPVFAGFTFGVARLFGPTGGYLLSFPFAALLVGYILEKNQSSLAIFSAFLIGELLILLAGAAYLAVFLNGNFSDALFSGAIIFSVWDIIKVAAAFSIYKAVSKKYPKLP
ncbi:MAG: biotin transporter BioY [Ignavibacteriae bacterium HGW-Ignavibacteriae-3]|nr:MAG: biotin transporter BioY [Ignavibacteriae bacterium HGW-Ignavibacteriae-3]